MKPRKSGKDGYMTATLRVIGRGVASATPKGCHVESISKILTGPVNRGE